MSRKVFSARVVSRGKKIGEGTLSASLKRETIRLNGNTRKALNRLATDIANDSRALAPHDTYMLKDACEVTPLEETGASVNGVKAVTKINVGYAITSNPFNEKTQSTVREYMNVVHDDTTRYHEDGEAKFLEKAIHKHKGRFFAIMKEIGYD